MIEMWKRGIRPQQTLGSFNIYEGILHIAPPFFEASSCLLGKRSLLGVTRTRPAGGE
ncbi:unnamed protein product [Ectocarpus sp. CCAP 1310/34]|nr:unnamed protein product [Ectocarpus sp. CCAP 1310/34]